uniref:Beta-defensin-like domain-containing protein n=1 Tax=Sarcophilus harrisii TaxID=9305 RepID=A0A7N4NZR7_SARHA
ESCFNLLFLLLVFYIVPIIGLLSRINNLICRVRQGKCRMIGCTNKEEQIGSCSLGRRKCCRKKK